MLPTMRRDDLRMKPVAEIAGAEGLACVPDSSAEDGGDLLAAAHDGEPP
jgi:hypothetical protein